MNELIKSTVTAKEIKWDGKPISAPGTYINIPIETYHGNLCVGPSVSSSGLRTIEAKTPAHYYADSYLNPNRGPREEKAAFDFGQAAHFLLLSQPEFNKHFVIRPDVFDNYRTKAAQEWRDSARAEGLIPLVPDDLTVIKAIAENLDAHPLARDLLRGKVERSIIFQDAATGVYLKSRPDVWTTDSIVADLKTTTDASPDAVRRTILDWGYAMQGALVGKAMKAVMGVEMTTFALVFVEKTPPYAVNVVEVDTEWLGYAKLQLRRAINTFADCVKANEWPAYQGEPVAHIPDWLRKRFDTERDIGLLPNEDAA